MGKAVCVGNTGQHRATKGTLGHVQGRSLALAHAFFVGSRDLLPRHRPDSPGSPLATSPTLCGEKYRKKFEKNHMESVRVNALYAHKVMSLV